MGGSEGVHGGLIDNSRLGPRGSRCIKNTLVGAIASVGGMNSAMRPCLALTDRELICTSIRFASVYHTVTVAAGLAIVVTPSDLTHWEEEEDLSGGGGRKREGGFIRKKVGALYILLL